MNIFVLDQDPVLAAQMMCDKHVVKMVLEYAQILCAHFNSGEAPYKRSYYNHPCTKWARKNISNYEWLVKHAVSLCNEYTYRYNRIHKSEEVIFWCAENVNRLTPFIPNGDLSKFAQAMPVELKNENVVKAYRSYYRRDKNHILVYTKRRPPKWIEDMATHKPL
jgi:hypothetical protein